MEIISTVCSVVAIVFSVFTFASTAKWEKKRTTIQAYIDLQECLYCLYEYETNEIKDFIGEFGNNEYKMISSVMGRIEVYAICVIKGIYDKKTSYNVAHGYIDVTLREKIEIILDYKYDKRKIEYYPYTRKLLKDMDERTIKE